MNDGTAPIGVHQGFGESATERMPMPPLASLDDAQKAAAKALIEGPRKGVFGPFVALLRAPDLLDRVAKLGEYLRFESGLDAPLRELVTCAAARHVSNQFEWSMHAPLALKAGVAPETIEALRRGARPRVIAEDEELALDFTRELLTTHGVSDPTYRALLDRFGEKGVVELSTLIGYFVMVSWLMNVARTPAQAGASGPALSALPQ
jgi:4-carboxymuconolactone decarboxylase